LQDEKKKSGDESSSSSKVKEEDTKIKKHAIAEEEKGKKGALVENSKALFIEGEKKKKTALAEAEERKRLAEESQKKIEAQRKALLDEAEAEKRKAEQDDAKRKNVSTDDEDQAVYDAWVKSFEDATKKNNNSSAALHAEEEDKAAYDMWFKNFEEMRKKNHSYAEKEKPKREIAPQNSAATVSPLINLPSISQLPVEDTDAKFANVRGFHHTLAQTLIKACDDLIANPSLYIRNESFITTIDDPMSPLVKLTKEFVLIGADGSKSKEIAILMRDVVGAGGTLRKELRAQVGNLGEITSLANALKAKVLKLEELCQSNVSPLCLFIS
jgi:hypothetical protein